METITNAATSVTSTVSNLIYGQPAKENETAHNETGGSEPISGAQGKGTVDEPFDQGNAEKPVTTSSATDTTSNKDDDFLKLNPTLGKPTSFEPSTGTTGSTAGETSMPIIPLNPDVASSSSTGTADKAVAAGGDWKPTELDAVKPSGAPGAGPSAPDYKVATPDTSLTSATSDKPAEHHSVDASKDTTSTPKRTEGVETSHSDTAKPQESVGGPIEEILNKGPLTKTEHTVDESEAKAPHSKMEDKTVRATTANKTGESGDVESHAAETPSRPSESSNPKSAEATSPSGGDEKSEKKMSQLKDKLKNKLHIGSKDK
jgi:hypothetical protein